MRIISKGKKFYYLTIIHIYFREVFPYRQGGKYSNFSLLLSQNDIFLLRFPPLQWRYRIRRYLPFGVSPFSADPQNFMSPPAMRGGRTVGRFQVSAPWFGFF